MELAEVYAIGTVVVLVLLTVCEVIKYKRNGNGTE